MAGALFAAAVPAPVLAAPQSPVAAEIKSSGKLNRDLKAFYRARDYRPLWIRNGTIGPEAARLVNLIGSARLDGLDPDDYDPEDLVRALRRAESGSPRALARAEIELSRAFADYVRDVRRRPEVNITYIDKEVEPVPPGSAEVLRSAAEAPSLMSYLENYGWMSPVYAELRQGLGEHHASWSSLPQFTLPAGPVLRPGSTGARVGMLRARLGLRPGEKFDTELASRVREFQSAHGLPVDAIVGPTTLAALNRGSDHHEWRIRVNMERARALPGRSEDRYILVDTASARLWLYEDGKAVDSMKVIVGKPAQQTPMLAGLVRFAAVNPYWNVPPDLVRDQIAPAVLDKGVSYIRSKRYEILSDWTEKARVLDAKQVDWAAVAAGRQELRVRQLPGQNNAMGDVKFMFPNDRGIFLHDTPERNLFKDDERRFSSGCVRLEDAGRLGEWLFGRPLRAKSDAPEQWLKVPDPVPIYITYLTAAPAENGIAFREDAYGRDEAQLAQLASR